MVKLCVEDSSTEFNIVASTRLKSLPFDFSYDSSRINKAVSHVPSRNIKYVRQGVICFLFEMKERYASCLFERFLYRLKELNLDRNRLIDAHHLREADIMT